MTGRKQRVVVVGASPKEARYSNRAVRLLLQHGHEVVPVNPSASTIEGLAVIPRLEDVSGHVNTLTLYVAAEISSSMGAIIIRLHPDRVIFNPGAENAALQSSLDAEGIHTEIACTLVLLSTGQF